MFTNPTCFTTILISNLKTSKDHFVVRNRGQGGYILGKLPFVDLSLFYGLFGWDEFGLMDLALRVQIQILCLDDLKPLGFGFGPNPSRILKAQIHGFQMTS
jgi:hypothetical protein